jgi:hypothetical protein
VAMNFLTSRIHREIVRRENFLTFFSRQNHEKTMRITSETGCSFTFRLTALLAAFSHFSLPYRGMRNEKRERPLTPPPASLFYRTRGASGQLLDRSRGM